MNKYIVPICDIQSGLIWNQVVLARTMSECQDKLTELLTEKYDLPDCSTYREFISCADENDILIGEFKDIETI